MRGRRRTPWRQPRWTSPRSSTAPRSTGGFDGTTRRDGSVSKAREFVVEPAGGTDFWQRTHYGFQADSGHFLYLEAAGDWDLSTEVRFAPAHQYDQAGLLVRLSPECWLKTSSSSSRKGRAGSGRW